MATKKKSSWKTTTGGVLTSIGAAAIGATQTPGIADAIPPSAKGWVTLAGVFLSILGPSLLGASARDNGVSSEDVGAKKSDR